MKHFILIDPAHPGDYYATFYLLAFLTGFVILMWEGHKRGFSKIPWMMVIGTAFLFFILGCRLITFSRNEWAFVLRLQHVPYVTGLSVLGGILFSIPGILLAKKCLGFKHEMVDSFSFVLPIAITIERFGCLMAGCCYGTPAELPWSVQYTNSSHAFVQQVHDGLLSTQAPLSLAVHPVQLYDSLGCLLIVLLLIHLRKVLRAPGNLFFTSIGLYTLLRFLLEFVRATGGHALGRETFFHLNYVQWTILFLLPLLFTNVWRKEIRFKKIEALPQNGRNEFFRPVFYFCLLTGLFLFVSRWLGFLEIVSFNIVLVPIVAYVAWHLFNRMTVPGYRWISLVLPMGALILQSQTLPEFSKSGNTRLKYNTISVGALGGNSMLTSQDCFGNTTDYENNYSAMALGISRTVQLGPDNSISFGVNGFSGSNHEVVSVANFPGSKILRDKQYSYYGTKPYIQYDGRLFGIGAGVNWGKLGTIGGRADDSVHQSTNSPCFSIRYGDLSKVFVEYKVDNQFPSSFPALSHQFCMGFGLGKRDGAAIRVGTASYVSFYLAPSIPAGEHFIVEPYLGFGGGLFNGYSSKPGNLGLMGSLSLHYKFNKRERQVNK